MQAKTEPEISWRELNDKAGIMKISKSNEVMNFLLILIAIFVITTTTALGDVMQLGWGGQNQQNTVGAVKRAFEAGAQGVEVDIRATQDGVAIGLHDIDLSSETNGIGTVSSSDWSDVMHLRHTNGGERVSKLVDILAEIKQWDREVFLDVRNVPAARVRAAVEESGFDESKMSVTLFTDAAAVDYWNTFPTIAGVYRKSYAPNSSFDDAFLDRIEAFGYTGLAFWSRPDLPPMDLMEGLKSRSLKSFAFVGNTRREVRSLNFLGVDYIVMINSFPAQKPMSPETGAIQVGWGGSYQLNTVEGIAAAALLGNTGYYMIDIQMTSDGVVIGMNDTTLDRETNGTGSVSSQTWADVSQFQHNNGDPIATLDELFTLIQSTEGHVFLDVGNAAGAQVEPSVVASGFDTRHLTILSTRVDQIADFRENIYAGVPVFRKTLTAPDNLSIPTIKNWEAVGYDGIFFPLNGGPSFDAIERIHAESLKAMGYFVRSRLEVSMESVVEIDYVVATGGFYP